MIRTRLFMKLALLFLCISHASLALAVNDAESPQLRVGAIGLDTSHVIAFTKALNDPNAEADIAGCKVVAAYPKGSEDIESSYSRIPQYTEDMKAQGVEVVDSIDALLEKVDVVLLETNDGKPHLEQAVQVMRAGKPVFIDKPIAASLADAVAIFEAAERFGVPVFSSSSLRYAQGAQEIRDGKIGEVKHAETHSPCSLEPSHPDLFWYGIHGVENLFTVMGTGCQSVRRTESTPEHDFVEGTWSGDRTGIFRGYREGGPGGYGGHAVGTEGEADTGPYKGYRPLLVDIVQFFRTGKSPVPAEETLEIYAFMEAADESKRQDGAEVTIAAVMETASAEAEKRLAEFEVPEKVADNQLTPEEEAAGWRLLFNGTDFTGWKTNTGQPIASEIEDGALVPHKSGGYLIVHEDQFGDFVLKCDVKMGPVCNSGIFFRVGNLADPVQTGFEAQVLNGEGTSYHDFGALYDLVQPSKNVAKGSGQWNHIELRCQGPEITVTVNGEVVTTANVDEFTEPGKRPDGTSHKFKQAVKDFPRTGYLGFQDHGHKVWFKNVKLLEL